jgi:hypothetical protein
MLQSLVWSLESVGQQKRLGSSEVVDGIMAVLDPVAMIPSSLKGSFQVVVVLAGARLWEKWEN